MRNQTKGEPGGGEGSEPVTLVRGLEATDDPSKIIGRWVSYVGTEQPSLRNQRLAILAVLKDGDPDSPEAYLNTDASVRSAGGIGARDRVEVAIWIERERRTSFATCDPLARDLPGVVGMGRPREQAGLADREKEAGGLEGGISKVGRLETKQSRVSPRTNRTPRPTMPKAQIDAAIAERVSSFVDDLTDLIRQAAVESVQEALGKGGAGARGATRAPGRPRQAPARAASKGGGKRVRRSAQDLEKAGNQILKYLGKHPGTGVSELAVELGWTSKDLKRPIDLLLADKAVKKKGQRRGTKYYAA